MCKCNYICLSIFWAQFNNCYGIVKARLPNFYKWFSHCIHDSWAQGIEVKTLKQKTSRMFNTSSRSLISFPEWKNKDFNNVIQCIDFSCSCYIYMKSSWSDFCRFRCLIVECIGCVCPKLIWLNGGLCLV